MKNILCSILFLFIGFYNGFASDTNITEKLGQPQMLTDALDATSPKGKAPETQMENGISAFFSSPMGISIAWIASVLGVIFGAIPLTLLYSERKKSRLLNQVLEQFHVKETIEKQKETANATKADIEAALLKSKIELTKLTREIEVGIPAQARAAFFSAALPEIEMQILSLSEQRKTIIKELKENGIDSSENSRIKEVLEQEIGQTVHARRKLDETQTILSIFSGFAAASAFLDVLGGLGYMFSAILGLIIVFISYNLGKNWAMVYPQSKFSSLIRSKYYNIIPYIFASSIIILIISLFYLKSNSIYY